MNAWLCVVLALCARPAGPAPPVPPPAVLAQAETAAAPQAGTGLPPEAAGDLPQATPSAARSDAPPPELPPQPGPATPPVAAAETPQHEVPAWRRNAVPVAAAEGHPAVAIMIDDMGMNAAQTARAVALPAPVTLAWLPYAPHVAMQAATAGLHGHETMLHMPMEAIGRLYPGPDALRTWLPEETNLAYLRAALDSLPSAVGLNQHEGSVASLSVPLMDSVMAELKLRGLAFVDSLTIPHSVALRRAQAAGLPAVARDVFLDNDPSPAAIRARLAEMEAIARHYGHAIAIGHPRASTIDALEHYLPTLAARGFVQWPVSAAIAADNRVQISEAPAR